MRFGDFVINVHSRRIGVFKQIKDGIAIFEIIDTKGNTLSLKCPPDSLEVIQENHFFKIKGKR